MLTKETAPLVIEITKDFFSLMKNSTQIWATAYLRFCFLDDVSETKASYTNGQTCEIFDVLSNQEFFHSMNDKGQALFATLNKECGVFLLTIESNFKYEIEFEYDDFDRWQISKLDGGTGLPK